MLTSVIGILLAASLGAPGSHELRPRDVCLMQDGCDRDATVCLADETRCTTWRGGRVCFVAHCPDGSLELVPRNRGSSL